MGCIPVAHELSVEGAGGGRLPVQLEPEAKDQDLGPDELGGTRRL